MCRGMSHCVLLCRSRAGKSGRPLPLLVKIPGLGPTPPFPIGAEERKKIPMVNIFTTFT